MSQQQFGPLPEVHPLRGAPCAICRVPFNSGDTLALIGDESVSPEDPARAEAGRTAVAHPVHWECYVVVTKEHPNFERGPRDPETSAGPDHSRSASGSASK